MQNGVSAAVAKCIEQADDLVVRQRYARAVRVLEGCMKLAQTKEERALLEDKLGWAYHKTGRLVDAEQAYRRALDGPPEGWLNILVGMAELFHDARRLKLELAARLEVIRMTADDITEHHLIQHSLTAAAYTAIDLPALALPHLRYAGRAHKELGLDDLGEGISRRCSQAQLALASVPQHPHADSLLAELSQTTFGEPGWQERMELLSETEGDAWLSLFASLECLATVQEEEPWEYFHRKAGGLYGQLDDPHFAMLHFVELLIRAAHKGDRTLIRDLMSAFFEALNPGALTTDDLAEVIARFPEGPAAPDLLDTIFAYFRRHGKE